MDNDDICESTQSHISTSTDSPDENTPVLPPCVICGGKASGFHYGANTCEPCKGFFRRCDKHKKAYKCRLGTGNCEIGPGHRNFCSFCRRQKCLSLGMSREGIKFGRYTLEKRTEIILELKNLKQNIPTSEQIESEQQIRSEQTTVLSLPSPSARLIGRTSPDSMQSFDVEQTIRTLIGTHREIIPSFGSFEDIKKLEKRCVEEYNLRLEVYGPPLSPLPDEQYEEVYRATGIDVDDRQSVKKAFGRGLENEYEKCIKFVKTIPGFSDLDTEDKANLVKSSLLDISFLGNFNGYNNELQIMMRPNGNWIPLSNIGKACNLEVLKELFIFGQTMKRLNLSPEEIVILKAVCVTLSDRCHLKDRRKVEDLQWRLIQCLMYLLERNHKETPGMFARVMDKLTAMRYFDDLYCKFARDVQRLPDIQNYPLLIELFDL